MGELMSKVCCISNNETIIKNKIISESLDLKNSSNALSSILPKSEKEKLPLSQMNSFGQYSSDISSEFPITSEYIIVKKEYSPLQDYEVISKLGEGTYGKVFKVKNRKTNDLRALKQISKYNLSNIDQKKIMQEVEILKNLNYTYIIKLYEYYVTKDFIFLINELSYEGDLQRIMWKIKIFPEFIVKRIMLQIFKALMYLNEKGIIHGDLKLENILVVYYNNNIIEKERKKNDAFIEAIKHDMKIINQNEYKISKMDTYNKSDNNIINDLNNNLQENTENKEIKANETRYNKDLKIKFDQENISNEEDNKNNKKYTNFDNLQINNFGIKLIDFGCSKIFTRTKKYFSDIIGTLLYCSPEVIYENYDKECDIWSCGVIMYYLLSGKFPFRGENEEEIKNKILEAKFTFDPKYFNNISENAKDLIRKCLIKDPKKRITIKQVLDHPFFDEVKKSDSFTENEKKTLRNLKDLNKKSKFYQIVLTYLSYNFSDDNLLNELNKLYNKFDRNSDCKITKVELYKAYKQANIEITPKEIETIINSMDFNVNGEIDYEEFIRMCIPKEKLFTEKNLKSAFMMFDKKNMGFITPQQIIDLIESTRHINDDLKLQIKKEIIDVADEIIDYEYFKELMIMI